MRRPAFKLIAAATLAASLSPGSPGDAAAQTGGRQVPNQPPHAWLFGTWTGGLFPAPSRIQAEACLSQPVVIFTRDLVMRATLTEQFYTQRLVETARAGPGGTEFRFVDNGPPLPGGLLGIGASPAADGFGCESPDVLHVQRISENEISFPGCADFPNPLIRCPSR